MAKNIDRILEFIKKDKEVQYAVLKKEFTDINEATLTRNLKKLQEKEQIGKRQKGRNTFYFVVGKDYIENYFDQPFFEREAKGYNKKFLTAYQPNKTYFLTEEQRQLLLEATADLVVDTDYYRKNRRGLENLLIDVSFASSKLEGNTYSYLDTEVLINYNEIAEKKAKEETQMIINHKMALEYLIYYKKTLKLTADTFFKTHLLLGKNLLLKQELGVIRNVSVEIGRCQYTPLETQKDLLKQFNLFLTKLNKIKNPFEQALFILVFIPYFQLFLDINKRTSRMMCNLPLLKHNLGIVSLLQVKKRDYVQAVLAIYELNDVSLMRDLFVENYLLNIKRYV